MSIDALDYGVQAEQEVVTWYRVRCDDSPSGFIQIRKTPPTGANAMTVTIKPLYGEAFTVNADLLRSAVKLALGTPAQRFDEAYRREHWRQKQLERLDVGDLVQIADRGRCNYLRDAAVERLDDYYAHVVLNQHPEEVAEGVPVQRRKVPRGEIVAVYDRKVDASPRPAC